MANPAQNPTLNSARPVASPIGQEADTRREPPSSALDLSPIETSSHEADICQTGVLPPPVGFQAFIHSGWQAIRSKVFAALVRTGQSHARCSAFAGCTGNAWLQFKGTDITAAKEFRVTAPRCHDRLCTPCSVARAWDLRLALYDQLRGAEHKFITLTLRTTPGEALTACIDRLYEAFRHLRRSRLWLESVKGGAAFLEVTRGRQADHWHTHLHIIADASYIPKDKLIFAWKAASQDSFIVDIQRASGDHAAHYVTKYVTKALSGDMLATPALLDEFIMAMKGRRLCLTFGTWYGCQALEKEDTDGEEDNHGWTSFLPLADACRVALCDPAVRAAIAATGFGRWLASPNAPGGP